MAKRPKLAKMAWRNLWRNRRRTWITLSSIALGSALALLFVAIQDRNYADMIDLAARMGGGHVRFQHPDYLDSPTLDKSVRDGALVALASTDPEVVRVVSRISGQFMLSSAEEASGAGFIAFDPAREDEHTLSLLEAVAEGRAFESASSPGIILGERLAKNLHTKIGRKVVFTLTDKEGEIVRDVTRVSGILRTGSPSVDGALALLPIGRVRQVLGYAPDESVEVALFLRDQRAAGRVAERLNKAGPKGGRALPWHEANPDLAGFIALKVGGSRIMGLVIMLLVVAGIFNTLLVSVMERSREFGVLMAVGFGAGTLTRLVLLESLFLGVLGVALGFAVWSLPYAYLATYGVDLLGAIGVKGTEIAGVTMSGRIYAGIYRESALAIGFATLAATLLAAIYPAWQAARVDPVVAIRGG